MSPQLAINLRNATAQCERTLPHSRHAYYLQGHEVQCMGRGESLAEEVQRVFGVLTEEHIQTPAAHKANDRPARVTKQQLENLLSDVVSETFVIADKARDLAYKLAEKERFADAVADNLGSVRNELTAERTKNNDLANEVSLLTASKSTLEIRLEAAQAAASSAIKRIGKDKRRIKALVNALAGLR